MYKLFNIEPTNHCNAKCNFCPNGLDMMKRPKGFMNVKTLLDAMFYNESDTVGIFGCGEPLLHPHIVTIVQTIAKSGRQCKFPTKTQLNTNGLLLTQKMYDDLRTAGLYRLIVSVDYFDGKCPDVEEHPDLPIERFVINREAKEGEIKKELHSWGEQVGHEDRERIECNFYLDGWVQVMWDGTIVRCCMDYDAKEPMSNVAYPYPYYDGQTISQCAKCKGFRFHSALVNGDYEGKEND